MKIRRYCYLIALVLLSGCTSPLTATPTLPPAPVATLYPTNPPPAPTTAASTNVPDTGWLAGRPGIELRKLQVVQNGQPTSLVIVRIDPAAVRLRVAYTPEAPRALRSWFSDTGALLAINGGFFTAEYRATALLVSDGEVSGESYDGFGGMLAVAPDGSVSIRPLRDQAYNPDEQLAQALQSFPMLIFPGNVPADLNDNGERTRRSALALDQAGRLLVIAAPGASWTLSELAAWLSQSDLNIDRALNLDGGSSTGLYVRDGDLAEAIDSFGPVPSVLLVEAK